MNVDPFIEAEEAAGHSVKRAASCSRSPGPPTTRAAAPSPRPGRHRRRADREDHRHPRRVQGHLRRPRGSTPSSCTQAWRAASAGAPADAPGRPRGPVQEALAQDHRPRSRRRGGQGPDPRALRPVRRRSTGARSATSPTSRPGRAGPTWPPSSTSPPAGSSAGRWPTTCAPSWSPTRSRWRSLSRARRRGDLPLGPRLSVHECGTSPSWPGPTAWCCRSAARASAGTTRWRRAFSPPSSASSSTPAPGRRGRTATRRVRLHRGLVQHPPAAQLARLPQPRRIRSYPPQRRPSGGMINTSNLSVEPDQAHP